jgi:hypothetical protein
MLPMEATGVLGSLAGIAELARSVKPGGGDAITPERRPAGDR